MKSSIRIGGRDVGPGSPVFIIAEIGVNHNGDPAMARELVEAAVATGADAVKFQTFRPEWLASEAAQKADYQQETSCEDETQVEMLRRLTLSPEAHEALRDLCVQLDIGFLSTPFDEDCADFLDSLPVPAFKLSSGDVTNWPLLRHVAGKGRPVILSTGMADMREVEQAVGQLHDAGAQSLILLHCVSNYPTAVEDVNLRAMQTMSSTLGLPVGFSDHTSGIESAIAAVALGACVIEKHLTLDRDLPGPDHRASMEPDAFTAYVRAIRSTEVLLGDGVKRPAASEVPIARLARRSLCWRMDLPEGTRISPEYLIALRPGTGISPTRSSTLLEQRTARPVRARTQVVSEDLESGL